MANTVPEVLNEGSVLFLFDDLLQNLLSISPQGFKIQADVFPCRYF